MKSALLAITGLICVLIIALVLRFQEVQDVFPAPDIKPNAVIELNNENIVRC